MIYSSILVKFVLNVNNPYYAGKFTIMFLLEKDDFICIFIPELCGKSQNTKERS